MAFFGTVTDEDFAGAVDDAINGDVFTDQGLNDELFEILSRIAEADEPTGPLIELANQAWEQAKADFPDRFTTE